jgi:hypothetical protein
MCINCLLKGLLLAWSAYVGNVLVRPPSTAILARLRRIECPTAPLDALFPLAAPAGSRLQPVAIRAGDPDTPLPRDRLCGLSGTLRSLTYPKGMVAQLWASQLC